MKLPAHSILKYIIKNREASLAELMPLIDKKFSNYKDYYPLAQLCISGYIGHEFSYGKDDEKLLASILYSCATGKKKVNNFTSSRKTINPELDMFHSTTKGELYFAEFRSKRSDRLYSIAIGIFIGICTAILAVQLGVK
ncbi:hypothetical protein A9Q92_00880, partial [Methylophaga sp. 42_8_T64]